MYMILFNIVEIIQKGVIQIKAYIEYLNAASEEIHFKKFITTIEDIALVVTTDAGEDSIRYIHKETISKITIYDLKA